MQRCVGRASVAMGQAKVTDLRSRRGCQFKSGTNAMTIAFRADEANSNGTVSAMVAIHADGFFEVVDDDVEVAVTIEVA